MPTGVREKGDSDHKKEHEKLERVLHSRLRGPLSSHRMRHMISDTERSLFKNNFKSCCPWGLVKARQITVKMVQSTRIPLGQGSGAEGGWDRKHHGLTLDTEQERTERSQH